MARYSYVASYDSGFRGNRNVSITAIDVSGGITCSRTSGKTPCFVHVSASAIIATGTTRPYEDLDYSWDFGDPSGVETITNPGVGGGTVNFNSSQTGPEAAYVYRSAGTFTVTLTIRGNRSSGHVLATVTQDITVTAFSASGGEYWADSAHGGTNAGTEANPFTTVAAINTAIGTGDNKHLHVKRGSVFEGSVSLKPWDNSGSGVTCDGLRIDAYGTGDKPIFRVTSGANGAFFMRNGGGSSPSPKNDLVVSAIRFEATDTATSGPAGIIASNATATVRDIYFDNCEAHIGHDNGDNDNFNIQGMLIERTGFWNCRATGIQTVTHLNMGYLYSTMQWGFIVGGYIDGGNDPGSLTREHHIYPNIRYHSLFRAIEFGAGPNRSYCINLNWDNVSAPLPNYAEYHLIADCEMTGVSRAVDAGENLNDPAETLFRNFVVQGNRIHDLTGDGIFLFYCVSSITLRDNEIWDCDSGRLYAPGSGLGSILTSHIYRNKIYHPTTAHDNDLISLPAANFVLPQTITDNIIVDLRTLGRITAIPFTQQTGATIDRNQYYAPNDANAKFLRDGTTDKSFAEWQAAGFDTNGSVANPNWTDPANGDFS